MRKFNQKIRQLKTLVAGFLGRTHFDESRCGVEKEVTSKEAKYGCLVNKLDVGDDVEETASKEISY